MTATVRKNPGANDRQAEIIQATYELLVEKGIEGLRVRDVAARVGINNATLLYYYSTKEAMIQALVGQLAGQFLTPNVADSWATAKNAREALHGYFAELRFQIAQTPERFRVMAELFLYARRDPQVREILSRAETEWQKFLVGLLVQGQHQGIFRADLNTALTSLSLITFSNGIATLLNIEPPQLEKLIRQYENDFISFLLN